MSKSYRFRTSIGNQHLSGSQALLKSALQHFYPILSQFWDMLSWKRSLLVKSEIIGLSVNILTTDDKYSRPNGRTLPQPIQM